MSREAAVREAAATYGIDIDDDEVAEYATSVGRLIDWLSAVEPDLPDATPPEAVEPGDDPHNAFRRRFALSGGDGPLSGLSVAVKDNLAVAGVEMTCGSAAFSFTPSYHATVVDRLLAAGADLVGTTNMDEFAYYPTGEACAHGRVTNPSAEGRVPGGSSSGSGAAVAAGLVDAALGSDTGGSIRAPAAFCGVVGIKPTHRSVPRFGFADLSPSLDHVGPLASDVSTAARVLEAIRGPAMRDPSSWFAGTGIGDLEAAAGDPVEGLSVGVVEESMDGAEPAVRERVEAGLSALRASGVETERVSLPGFEDATVANSAITGTEFASLVANDGLTHGVGTGYSREWRGAVAAMRDAGEYGDLVRTRLLENRAVATLTRGEHYVAARDFQSRFAGAAADRLDEHDALVTPTAPMVPPEYGAIDSGEGRLRVLAHTAPFNLTGQPAVSVPCGDGLPVGLQVVAGWGEEATAVRIAGALEAA